MKVAERRMWCCTTHETLWII